MYLNKDLLVIYSKHISGSGKIQDLGYRCQWYMVTQKGIHGITPYEKITYSHKNNWANVLNEKLCVPFKSK